MSNITSFRASYQNTKNTKNTKSFVDFNKIDATMFYLKHHFNVIDMCNLMRTALSFNDKCDLRNMIDVANRKKEYFYRHKNFDIKRALCVINACRK